MSDRGKFVYLTHTEMCLLSQCIESWTRGIRKEIKEKGIGGLAYDIAEGGAQQLDRLKGEFDRFIQEN